MGHAIKLLALLKLWVPYSNMLIIMVHRCKVDYRDQINMISITTQPNEMSYCQKTNVTSMQNRKRNTCVIKHIECADCTRDSNFTLLYYTGHFYPENSTEHNVLNGLLRIGQSLRMGHAIKMPALLIWWVSYSCCLIIMVHMWKVDHRDLINMPWALFSSH